jgi:hypothetical protein
MVCICCKCVGCRSAVHRKHVVKFAAVSRALYPVHSVTLCVKRFSSIRTWCLVMPTAMATRRLNRLSRRQRWRVAQIGREHQNQRRNDAESQKRI